MTHSTCETVRDLLIEYADGDLDEGAIRTVRRHLEDCGACRTDLAVLQISLGHARELWEEAAAGLPLQPVRRTKAAQPRTTMAAVVGAACVLALVTAGLLLLWNTRHSGWLAWGQGQTAAEQPPAAPEVTVPMAEIESLIARETRSARLAASSRLLAEIPALADYRRDADRYLATAYEDSQAGQQASKRLNETSTSPISGI